MAYRFLLIDNDNTLMDFSAAERASLMETMQRFGIPATGENAAAYSRINDAQWKALERGETTRAKLRVERFRQFLEFTGFGTLKAEEVGSCYEGLLSHNAALLPGALDFMRALHGKIKLSLLTNGVTSTQRGRLAVCAFTPLLDDVVISEEIGLSKPDPRMVWMALERLGCTNRSEAVLMGDSLTADIAAARNAGIDSIWYAPKGGESDMPTMTARNYDEALKLILD